MEQTTAISRDVAIEVTPEGDERILRVSGACGAKCAAMLAAEIQKLVRSGAKRLSLDLSQADYVETPVLRVILDWARELASFSDASLSVKRLSPGARRTFDLLKLDWLLSDEAKKLN